MLVCITRQMKTETVARTPIDRGEGGISLMNYITMALWPQATISCVPQLLQISGRSCIRANTDAMKAGVALQRIRIRGHAAVGFDALLEL